MVGILGTSMGAILVRLAYGEGVPSLSIAAWRLVFASAILLPYAALHQRGQMVRFEGREMVWVIVSGLFLGLHFATWIASLAYTSVASSVVLVSTGPVFVGLGSWVILREPPTPRQVAGMGLAAVGSVVISWGDFGGGTAPLLGDLLALTGAVMVAGYLMIGRHLRARRSVVAYAAPVYGVAMLVLVAIALLSGQPMAGFPPMAFLWLLALGVVPQLIGHTSLNWALGHLSATLVAMATLAEPVGASILAYLLLGETVGWTTGAGGAVVLAGIYLASRGEARRRRAEE
ncbi:MAG: EamA family transporter [Armatimonadia bacterium]|nr:EamA family transporter [Armatimonadia bacterium]